ncbi:MAG: FIST C-terminal domain-containing protein [Planctomycetota bacterium]|jgi:hypothetical protein|nr:FIST C-terminal domain-containing protein [Planctomycetota bacterium]
MWFRNANAIFASADPKQNAMDAIDKMERDLVGFPVAALLFFASPSGYDCQTLAYEAKKRFPDARTFGCSGAGVLQDGAPREEGVAGLAFSPDALDSLEITALGDINNDSAIAEKTVASLEARVGQHLRQLNHREWLGFILVDGLASSYEAIVERIGDSSDIVLLGGLAGDEAKFEKTLVWADGRVYRNGIVIALMKPKGKWGVIKTQSVIPTDQTLVATRIDADRNVILEFDGRPAAEAYATVIGVPKESLSPELFTRYPLALFSNGEPFIRSIAQYSHPDALRLYTKPIPDIRYTVAEIKDLIGDTRSALEAKRRELGSVSAIVNVTCILRKIQIAMDGTADAHQNIFAGIPSAGFFSFGEIYIGVINQTATMVVFA